MASQFSLPMLAPLLFGTGILLRSIRTNASLIFPRIGVVVVLLWMLWFFNSVVQNTVVYLRRQASPGPPLTVASRVLTLLDPRDDYGIRILWLSHTVLHSIVTCGAGGPRSDQGLPLLPEGTGANNDGAFPLTFPLTPSRGVYGVRQQMACESPSARSAKETGLAMICMPPWCG